MKKEHAVFLLGTLIWLMLDQFVKNKAELFWAEKPMPINSFIALEYTKNTGIAFGIPITGTLLLFINIIIIIVFVGAVWKTVDFSQKIALKSAALILAGAMGNLIDRLRFGFVRDFISIGPWPTFNLADMYITIGVALFIIFHKKIFFKKPAP